MTLNELFEDAEAATVGTGSIATIAQPLLTVRRTSTDPVWAKYTVGLPRNDQRKKNARRQFKNSISN